MIIIFQKISKYRNLIFELVVRDLKLRYRRSVLGYIWTLLNPLLMMIILTIVFSSIFRFEISNYPVYLLCGQILVGFYAEATTASMSSIVANGGLIRKVYIPKFVFPFSKILSALINFAFALLALLIVMLWTQLKPNVYILLLPIPIVMITMFSMGISLVLSVFAVSFRDTVHLYGVLLTALTYLTPIFYPVSILPEWFSRYVLVWNPLYHYVTIFRDCVLLGKVSDPIHYIYGIGAIIVANLIGTVVFIQKIKTIHYYL